MLISKFLRSALILGVLITGRPSKAGEAVTRNLALVIASSGQPPLPTCQMSTRLMAASLTRVGFQVTELIDPSNAQTGTAIASIGDLVAAAPGARSVIYVCGRVAPYAERLFLLPSEARLERPTDVLTQGIVARLLMSSVAAPGTNAGLVLMDIVSQSSTDAPISFGSMLRPGDSAHAGLVATLLPATAAIGPSSLASAFSDLLHSGNVDLATAIPDLRTTLSAARTQTLIARAPDTPSWLIGGPTLELAQAAVAPTLPAPTPPAAGKPALSGPNSGPMQVDPARPNAAERRRIQLALQHLGYFHGHITGMFAADTMAAIRHFQQESNEPATGKLTVGQLTRLLGS